MSTMKTENAMASQIFVDTEALLVANCVKIKLLELETLGRNSSLYGLFAPVSTLHWWEHVFS